LAKVLCTTGAAIAFPLSAVPVSGNVLRTAVAIESYTTINADDHHLGRRLLRATPSVQPLLGVALHPHQQRMLSRKVKQSSPTQAPSQRPAQPPPGGGQSSWRSIALANEKGRDGIRHIAKGFAPLTRPHERQCRREPAKKRSAPLSRWSFLCHFGRCRRLSRGSLAPPLLGENRSLSGDGCAPALLPQG
jgi:hypothetical protein